MFCITSKSRTNGVQQMSVNIMIIIAVFAQAFFIIIVNHYIFILNDFASLKSMLPFINFFMVSLTVFLLYSIKKLETNAKRRVETNLLKEHLKQIEDLIKTIQTQKHDHTKHLQTLQAMVHLEEIEAAKNYIDGIAENYWYTEEIVNAGHPVLTALLNSKCKIAEIKKIKFDFSIKCDFQNIQFSSWDLCSILGNLIDNAFEAVIESAGEKNVGLEIKAENGNFVIYVINSGAKISDKGQKNIFIPGFTTKDSEGRGYGLFIVKKLVDKYGGMIQVVSHDKTTFIISLPLKGENTR